MFVVVHLIEPKKRIIVPENFILGLSEQSLKNYGTNSNINYTVYWSKDALGDENNEPNANHETNFRLAKSNVYPPDDLRETCYNARLKYFFSKNKIVDSINYILRKVVLF